MNTLFPQCSNCGVPILAGQMYYDNGGSVLCQNCGACYSGLPTPTQARPIQIAASDGVLYALFSDGTLWQYYRGKWSMVIMELNP